MKKGFTLVELSIVLVIIGLLIGGILVAQSLIDSAKINKAVSQLQQFDIAVQQFKSKYGDLPGDSPKFTSTTYADGNGIIEGGVGRPTRTYDVMGENAAFWPMLQASGFVIEGISEQMPIGSTMLTSRTSIDVSSSGQNVPKLALGQNTGVGIYSVGETTLALGTPFNSGTLVAPADIPPANYYFLADFQKMADGPSVVYSYTGNATRNWDENIPVASAASLDKKMDDGNPRTGGVLNGSYTAINTGCTTSVWVYTYDVSNSEGLCTLQVRMTD